MPIIYPPINAGQSEREEAEREVEAIKARHAGVNDRDTLDPALTPIVSTMAVQMAHTWKIEVHVSA